MTLLPRTDGAGWPWGWPAAGRRSMRSDYACLPQGEQEGEKVRKSSPRNQSGDRRITQTASLWTEGSGETGSGHKKKSPLGIFSQLARALSLPTPVLLPL